MQQRLCNSYCEVLGERQRRLSSIQLGLFDGLTHCLSEIATVTKFLVSNAETYMDCSSASKFLFERSM